MNSIYLSLKNISNQKRKIGIALAITVFVFSMVMTAGCTGPSSSTTINAGTVITESPAGLTVRETSDPGSTLMENMTGGNPPSGTRPRGTSP